MATQDPQSIDDVPDLLSDSDENDDSEDEGQWEDVEDEEMSFTVGDVTCLFCNHLSKSTGAVLDHIKSDHNFNLVRSCRRMDCVGYIKMINCIRKERPSVEDVKRSMASGHLWADDAYMMATDPNDLLLQFDIESAQDDDTSERLEVNGDGPDLSESEAIAALVQRTQQAERERDALKEELQRALQDINTLRLAGQQMMIGAEEPKKPRRNVLHEDDGYFASYSHFGIHQTMLMDKVRTESYRDFMLNNPDLFKGKLVLDVGCGTGILSMFAAKAGAERVVAVDQSNIIYQAMDIVRENGLHDKITFVKGRLEDVTLPVEKFDVIISEWMGYFLLFEAMLDSVLWARDHCLKPDGCVYPDKFNIQLVGVCDPNLRQTLVDYWTDVYGFRMSCMRGPVLGEVHVKRLSGDIVATQPAVIKEIDVMSCSVKDLDFFSEFTLQCERDCEISAIVGYFDTEFSRNCQNKVQFSTGPQATPTHWDQAVMLLPQAVPVTKGMTLQGSITYRKHPNDDRGVCVLLVLGKQKMKYSLS